MKGIIFAVLGGVFITLQSTANAAIGDLIGSWQAAALTQGTGFAAAMLIVWITGDRSWRRLNQVKLHYRFGGALAAFIIFSSITAFHRNGAAVTVSAMLISQILATLGMEKAGWFGDRVLRLRAPQWIGIMLMITGILCLSF
ncbi:DMT family transporter [Paenibacillus lignilyticus]|uniref:DMT family transporter n=1 Tax=Paenibacillus lignilyticus TaxID=1172615 RepID=A0ABS5CBQ2_9BACL|nr:DMT family transporter [Paenibacillus lignilyticus]MBP3963132.1 DMT family transporter [Paenibacillus lignilyticus]